MGRPRINDEICAIEGCELLTAAFNRCHTHYQSWRKSLPYWPIKHGTNNARTNLHCRCIDCRAVGSQEHREAYKKIGVGPNTGSTVDASREYWSEFKAYCKGQGRSMRSVALDAIEHYMKSNP